MYFFGRFRSREDVEFFCLMKDYRLRGWLCVCVYVWRGGCLYEGRGELKSRCFGVWEGEYF